jgi:hypothetical protein
MRRWFIIPLDRLQAPGQELQQIPLPLPLPHGDPLCDLNPDDERNSHNAQENDQSNRGVIIIDM